MSNDLQPGIVNPKVEKYLEGLLRPRSKVLSYLEKDAEKNGVPIIGSLCGNLLALIATGCRAKNILEIGTATGYSGICLGLVAKKNSGKVITIEMDPDRRAIANRSFSDAGLDRVVKVILGDAREIVPRVSKEQRGKFDLVLLDVGDKSIYVELLEPLIDAIRVGGYLIADNTLWGGSVAVASDTTIETKTLRKFNSLVYEDERLLPVIIPLRDGLTIALKTSK
ncbi:MAG: O-methyltransferase [Rhabdochlamydiaceae bacterium]